MRAMIYEKCTFIIGIRGFPTVPVASCEDAPRAQCSHFCNDFWPKLIAVATQNVGGWIANKKFEIMYF